MTGPEISLKIISLLIVEKSLFIDDGVDRDEGILKFMSLYRGNLILKSEKMLDL